MMGFDRKPVLAICDEAHMWQVIMPLRYRSKAGEVIAIPAGFYTNLASIPRLLHSLIPVNGRHRPAAILHDYLYVVQDRPRAAADALFLEAMRLARVPWLQRNAMWLAVRLCGGVVWRALQRHCRLAPYTYWRSHGLAPVRPSRKVS